MAPTAPAANPSFPPSHILSLAELVGRWSVTLDQLLQGSGLDATDFDDPALRLSVTQCCGLLERARQLTGEPALGYLFGRHLPVTAHGSLAMIAQAAPTIRDAIELALPFWPILTTTLSLRLRVDGPEASILVEEHADFGSARDIVLLTLLLSLSRIGSSMAGVDLRPYGHADVAMPAPAYAAFAPIAGSQVRFDQPVTRLVFDASRLSVPHTLQDPIALRFARNECERTLDSLEASARTAARVRALLNRGRGGVPSVAEVAGALGTSPRTLKRQLAGEGTSFSLLVEEELRERALLMLRSSTVSTRDVAASLGYSNASNFTRAFVRWTGRTPTEQRQAADPVRR